MKATGIVIPKEIRRTMRIREGDPLQRTLTLHNQFCLGMIKLAQRICY